MKELLLIILKEIVKYLPYKDIFSIILKKKYIIFAFLFFNITLYFVFNYLITMQKPITNVLQKAKDYSIINNKYYFLANKWFVGDNFIGKYNKNLYKIFGKNIEGVHLVSMLMDYNRNKEPQLEADYHNAFIFNIKRDIPEKENSSVTYKTKARVEQARGEIFTVNMVKPSKPFTQAQVDDLVKTNLLNGDVFIESTSNYIEGAGEGVNAQFTNYINGGVARFGFSCLEDKSIDINNTTTFVRIMFMLSQEAYSVIEKDEDVKTILLTMLEQMQKDCYNYLIPVLK